MPIPKGDMRFGRWTLCAGKFSTRHHPATYVVHCDYPESILLVCELTDPELARHIVEAHNLYIGADVKSRPLQGDEVWKKDRDGELLVRPSTEVDYVAQYVDAGVWVIVDTVGERYTVQQKEAKVEGKRLSWVVQ